MNRRPIPARLILVLALVGAPACGDDDNTPVASKRGSPGFNGGKKDAESAIAKEEGAGGNASKSSGKAPSKPATKTPAKPAKKAAVDEEEELPADLPKIPPVALDSKSFQRRRDPFLNTVAAEVVVPEPDRPRAANRRVSMQQYAFEDLKLVAIANGGRGVKPRALFVASDGKSGTIKQGDYFSSAELLLAAVNRDYVEIEVVDDDLASSLNLQRGERRAIYLRNE